jgi:hypothetical protein
MSETTQAVANPYAVDNMPEGGGLTREVVVMDIKHVRYGMTYKSGEPVVDDRTKQQSIFTGVRIDAVSLDPGHEQKPGKYEYSTGRKGKPSADGEQLLNEDGTLAKLYKNSAWGEVVNNLRAGGFDPTQLFPRVSVLKGAKLTMEGRDQKKADGTTKTYIGTDKKVHNSIEWVPTKFNGYVQGGAGASATAGNGADLSAKAEAAVVAALAEAGGSIERKDLIRAIGTALKGDADAIKVTTLIARQDFHANRPWGFEGSTLTLGA